MTSALTIHAVQYRPKASAEENLEAMESYVQRAARSGASMVVFPEYSECFIPGEGPAMAERAQGITGIFVAGLSRLSADNGGILIGAGMLLREDAVRNTMVAVGPDGLVARAEKIHLYDAFGYHESSWFAQGRLSEPQLVSVGDHTIGFIACYDLRFPETTRRLVDAGATVIVIPAQWVPGPNKLEHWNTLVRARAIESQCFVVAAGHPEPHGVGFSQIVSPRGEVLDAVEDGEGVASATLQSSVVEAVRAENPMAQVRRFTVAPRTI